VDMKNDRSKERKYNIDNN